MVRFENVGMRYSKGPEVLHDVSFALPPGSFPFLVGASGAGKSSLILLLFRILDATAKLYKNVELRGKTIENLSTCTGYSMMGPLGVEKFDTVRQGAEWARKPGRRREREARADKRDCDEHRQSAQLCRAAAREWIGEESRETVAVRARARPAPTPRQLPARPS